MAITEKKTETVTVADAKARGSKVHVTIGRDLTVGESRELRKLLKKAEAWVSCGRPHDTVAELLAGGLWPSRF